MCRKIGGISSIDFIYFCGKKAAPSTGTDWKEAHGRIRDAPEPESEASLMPNTARARETTEEWRFEKGPKKEDKTNLGNFWCVLVLSSACWGSRVGRYVLLETIEVKICRSLDQRILASAVGSPVLFNLERKGSRTTLRRWRRSVSTTVIGLRFT